MPFLSVLLCACCLLPLAADEAPALPAFDPGNCFISVNLGGFFPGPKGERGADKRLNLYLLRMGGAWISALGTATNNGKPIWNTALMPTDPAGLSFDGRRLSGVATVVLAPDPWVPGDHRARTAAITLDAQVVPDGGKNAIAGFAGTWASRIDEDEAALTAARLFAQADGRLSGGLGQAAMPEVAGEASYDLKLTGLIPGDGAYPNARRAISLGVEGGKAISVRLGMVDIRHNPYDYQDIPLPTAFAVQSDGSFSASLAFAADTLDGKAADFAIAISGRRLNTWLAGPWQGTCTVDGKAQAIAGFFRGELGAKAVRPAAVDGRPWFVQDPKVTPFAAGEHPRLFFRAADVPELRRRAATAEGQRIIARLRRLLNGSDGESMPTSYNPATQAYVGGFDAVDGTYTISHAAGFGFLYQITGERKYADFARQCVEKGFAGQRDRDDRYAWVAPGGQLRAGPSIGWTGVAYDLCYAAWPEDFRVRVARAIQDYADERGGEWNRPEGITMRKLALTPNQGPGSNHYGAVVGGAGLGILAIKGDPGTDGGLLDTYWRSLETNVVRHASAGWGDGGYYNEGWGASRVGTQTGYLCLLQAIRCATGRDYLNVERPNISYITLVPRSLMLLGPPAHFPYRSNMGPSYGSPELPRDGGLSFSGYFCEGFGAVAERYKPALLWTYNHVYDPDPARRGFDDRSAWPHRPMLALINWPGFSGIEERNPAGIMPRATRDHLYEYMVFRNRWQDADDLVATVLLRPPKGTHQQAIMAWGGGGLRLDLGTPAFGAAVSDYRPGEDGSGTVAAGAFAMAVDYSRASGADALIVTTTAPKEAKDSAKVRYSRVSLAGTAFTVVTICLDGRHPAPAVDGERLVLGGQSLRYADGRLSLATFTPVAQAGAGALP